LANNASPSSSRCALICANADFGIKISPRTSRVSGCRKRMGKEIKFTRKIETKTAENSYKDSQGKEYYYDVLGVKDSEQYLIRSDGYDGFVWYSQLDPTHKRRAEMGSFSETVKTAGKTYENCLLVTYSMSMPDGAAFIEKVWYAKNVGMVKRQILTLKPNGKFSVQEEIHLESHKKAQ